MAYVEWNEKHVSALEQPYKLIMYERHTTDKFFSIYLLHNQNVEEVA